MSSTLNTRKEECKGEKTEEMAEGVGNEMVVFNRTGCETMEVGETEEDIFDDSVVFKKATDLIKRLNAVSDSNPMDCAREGQLASNLVKSIVGKLALMIGKLKGSETMQKDLREKLHNLQMENIDLQAKLENTEAHCQEQLGLTTMLEYFQNELENEFRRRVQVELELARLRSPDPQQIALENSQEEDPLLPSVDEGIFVVPTSLAPLPVGPPPPSLTHCPKNTKERMELEAGLEPTPPGYNSSTTSSVPRTDSKLQDFTHDDVPSNFESAPSIMSIDNKPKDSIFSLKTQYRPQMRKSQRARKPTDAALALKTANKKREHGSSPSSPIPGTSRQALAEMVLMTPKKTTKSTKRLRHMRDSHNKSNKFICPFPTCKQRFQRANLLNSHKRLKHSSSGRTLKCRHKHLATHNQEKKCAFVCAFCSRAFHTERDRKRHQQMHKNKPRKIYFCKFCSKGFVHKQACAKHENDMHTERFGLPSERPYSCGECKKNFKSVSDLKSHLVVHSNEKPFVCDVCQKDFKRKSELVAHKRIHNREMLYKCTFCNKGFPSNTSMNIHKKLHSKLTDLQCSFCTKTFVKASDCRHHVIKIHNSNKNRN